MYGNIFVMIYFTLINKRDSWLLLERVPQDRASPNGQEHAFLVGESSHNRRCSESTCFLAMKMLFPLLSL